MCLSQGSDHQGRRETMKHCRASCASKPLYQSVLFILPPNIMCPPQAYEYVLAKLHVSLYQLTSLCHLACVHGSHQHTTRSFWSISPYWIMINGAQLCSVRWSKVDWYMHVISKESFIVCPFTVLALVKCSFTCASAETFLHKSALVTYLHLCPLQWNIPSHVCFSKMSFHLYPL